MAHELECYLVGGAVRDELLGREVIDRDWVVVGSSAEQMHALGYSAVGRDFPVFLHPQTHEEYALARTERKQGRGHRGFVVNADPSVTLEEDLRRRDLTINAMARSAQGELIDPYGGAHDLEAKVLRHVSSAFAEDPLRVFRVARFAAQLPDFSVAEDTLDLMRQMAAQGELTTLSAERVWQEMFKALGSTAPERFFDVLAACGALDDWLPELVAPALSFQTRQASMRFAELPLNETEFCALAERLKVPNGVLAGALDRLRWGAVVADWRAAPATDLGAAFEHLKVTHASTRLDWLAEFLRLSAQDRAKLGGLAQGWRGVQVEDNELQGPAYGEALRAARERWLVQARAR